MPLLSSAYVVGALSVPLCLYALYLISRRLLSKTYKVMAPGSAVVITGSSTGIGKSLALWLARKGYVVFAAVRKIEDGRALQSESDGNNIVPIIIDVAIPATTAEAVATVKSELRRRGIEGLSCLINNAGISESQPAEVLDLNTLRRVFEVNLVGVVDVTQQCLPLLREARAARIINISSISGKIATPFNTIYSSSKFALEAASDCLRRELLPWNIAVIVLEPGYIRTPIQEKGLALQKTVYDSLQNPSKKYYSGYYTEEAILHRYNSNVSTAVSVQEVVDSMDHAMFSEQPQTRYMMGKDAPLAKLSLMLPDYATDAISARRYWPSNWHKAAE